jgi:hypothetical protein
MQDKALQSARARNQAVIMRERGFDAGLRDKVSQ